MKKTILTKKYNRKTKENKPVIAICYDFDKTLSPDDMQAQGYIQSIDYNVNDFWKESNKLSEDNCMDQNLAYMYKMVDGARGKIVFNKATLEENGSRVKLFPGVEEWFERTKKYGEQNNVIIEHYVISSGLKEMIEGTSIAKKGVFERIYACSFYYNDRGEAVWPAQVVNYTNKTQFLFRIQKGVLDVNDSGVNDYFEPDKIRVPFRNMIYIGDSDTDIPCMKVVNSNGGYSIGVYDPDTADKTKVYRMMTENRIKYFAPADYSKDSKLDSLVKTIIERTAKNEVLESYYYDNKNETTEYLKSIDPIENEKANLIDSLKNSFSFATTHEIIEKLDKHSNWSDRQIEKLLKIAIVNNQVGSIINDVDVKSFYENIISEYSGDNDKLLQKVKDIIND